MARAHIGMKRYGYFYKQRAPGSVQRQRVTSRYTAAACAHLSAPLREAATIAYAFLSCARAAVQRLSYLVAYTITMAPPAQGNTRARDARQKTANIALRCIASCSYCARGGQRLSDLNSCLACYLSRSSNYRYLKRYYMRAPSLKRHAAAVRRLPRYAAPSR